MGSKSIGVSLHRFESCQLRAGLGASVAGGRFCSWSLGKIEGQERGTGPCGCSTFPGLTCFDARSRRQGACQRQGSVPGCAGKPRAARCSGFWPRESRSRLAPPRKGALRRAAPRRGCLACLGRCARAALARAGFAEGRRGGQRDGRGICRRSLGCGTSQGQGPARDCVPIVRHGTGSCALPASWGPPAWSPRPRGTPAGPLPLGTACCGLCQQPRGPRRRASAGCPGPSAQPRRRGSSARRTPAPHKPGAPSGWRLAPGGGCQPRGGLCKREPPRRGVEPRSPA